MRFHEDVRDAVQAHRVGTLYLTILRPTVGELLANVQALAVHVVGFFGAAHLEVNIPEFVVAERQIPRSQLVLV